MSNFDIFYRDMTNMIPYISNSLIEDLGVLFERYKLF